MEKMEKTIESTARALASLSSKDTGPSKGFQSLIRQIGEAKTKHEEDRIIKKEAVLLKERVGSRDTTPRQMREYLIRLIYCEMLGLDCSWGYIHAVKFTQQGNTMDKRIGYLAVSLFLHENHELNMLLVNTLQRDLKSSNMLEVSMALIIICKLIGSEMIPPLLPLVQDKLLHPKELVRKKAIMVMHHFLTLNPGLVSHLEDDFRRTLSDPDPGVMEASLVLFHELVKNDTTRCKDLTESFTDILSQVIARKLPQAFDYHSVPSPWIQMRLLRILALLGTDDLKTSEKIYQIVESTLASAECTSNIGQAISYECIRTITTIYPNNALIEKAAKAIARFMASTNNNWRYLGVNALASVVQINPKYAAEHQMVVIDCLDDPDETLKRKTLDLLFKMTNPLNVVVISDRLIEYLRQTSDEYIQSDLVAKITQLAERFAPNNQWFLQTMNAIFEHGGHLVRREVAHNLMRLIAEGTEDEETDQMLRQDAISSYLALLDKPHLPDILIKIICWVVGEYAYVSEEVETEEILERVTSLLNRKFEDPDTHGWVIAMVTKLVSQLGYMPDGVQSQVAVYLTSTNTDIQQRCSELVELSRDLSMMQSVLPLDSSCEDLEVDSSLSFLDEFVSEALVRGASAYKPAHLRSSEQKPAVTPHAESTLKYQPYAVPRSPALSAIRVNSMLVEQNTSPVSVTFGGGTPPASSSPAPDRKITSGEHSIGPSDVGGGLAVKVRVWGRSGYQRNAIPVVQETTTTGSSLLPSQEEVDVKRTLEPQLNYQQEDEERQDGDSTGDSTTALSSAQASISEPSAGELKRRELASQLFGGLTGPARAPRPKQQQRKGASGPSGGEKTVPPQAARGGGRKGKHVETDLLLDLQDIDFSPPVSGFQPTHDLPGTEKREALDHQTQSSAGNTTTNTSTSGSADLLGLLDGPITMETTPQTLVTDSVGHAPSASGTSLLAPQVSNDVSLLNPTPSSLQPVMSKPQESLALTLFENPVGTIRVPSEYASYPAALGWDNKDVCHDANLRVSLTKVLKPDHLVVVIFLTNQKQSEQSEVTLSIEPPSNMKASTAGGEADLTIHVRIPGFGNVTHVITLLPSSPAINMSLQGQITYKDNVATQRRLFFDTTIQVSDVIRPLEITTQEFGKKWGSLSYEKKLKLQSSVKKPPELMEVLKKQFNLYPVQLIGSEGIAAGTFLPTVTCLVHIKVATTQLEFWVRTPSSLLTESIGKMAQAVLK